MIIIIFLVLFVLMFLLIRFLVNKFSLGSESKRKLVIIVSSIIATPIVFIGILIIVMSIIFYYPEVPFNKEQWAQDSSKRYTMSEDIIETNLLIGLEINEIIDLLGTDYYQYDEKIEYYIGFVPGLLSLSPDILVLKIQDGVVESVIQDISKEF